MRWHLTTDGGCHDPLLLSPQVDWVKLAEAFAFFLDAGALTDAEAIPGAIGELVWIRLEEDTQLINVVARPALIVHPGNGRFSLDRIEILPHCAAGDPLLRHIVLVLREEIEATASDAHLYAELLADALAVHFLKRNAATGLAARQMSGGLPPYKLGRVIAYIEEHLEQELSLIQLAAVANTSVAHFARLFKQSTGSTPHHYVLVCRIEHAKRLLASTDLPLSEVAQRIGLADQSHLTALFRIYVAATPKAYRDSNKHS